MFGPRLLGGNAAVHAPAPSAASRLPSEESLRVLRVLLDHGMTNGFSLGQKAKLTEAQLEKALGDLESRSMLATAGLTFGPELLRAKVCLLPSARSRAEALLAHKEAGEPSKNATRALSVLLENGCTKGIALMAKTGLSSSQLAGAIEELESRSVIKSVRSFGDTLEQAHLYVPPSARARAEGLLALFGP